MQDVLFVVPYAMETTLRFVRAMAALPGVRLGLVSQEPASRLPDDVRSRLAGYRQVSDPSSTDVLEGAVREIAREWGGSVDRLVAILEQLQEPVAEVRERLRIRGMDLGEARNFRDKARMKDLLRQNGVPCARHCLARSAPEAMAFAEEILPLVAKPPSGAGARNTFRVDGRDELASYLRTVPPTTHAPLLLEEFIVGREHSFDSVSLHGQHVFHSISHYHPTPLEVLQNPWIQWVVVLPRDVEGPEYDDIRAAGRRALDVLGMVTGITHMEWFRREDGSLAISEVAARPPGAQFTSLLSFAHDHDFYAAWAELMVFERFRPPERRWAVGALFLRAQGSGDRVRSVRGIEEAQRELGELVVQARLPQQGQSPSGTYEGDGYVILRHPETSAVMQGMERLMELIHVDLG